MNKLSDYKGPILEVENLSISFFTRLREIPAVMDFSIAVQPGEAVGLVGESGCGKSTVALGVMQDLGVNGKIVDGSIKFKGQDLGKLSPEVLRDIRGNEIAMIYQEPMASLNPAMKIANQLMEVPYFLPRFLTRSTTAASTVTSKAVVGSSNIKSDGFDINAIAITIRCCLPPES